MLVSPITHAETPSSSGIRFGSGDFGRLLDHNNRDFVIGVVSFSEESLLPLSALCHVRT